MTPQSYSGQPGRAAEPEEHCEERIGSLLDSAEIGFWRLDLRTDIVVTSSRHDRIFGHGQPLPAWDYTTLLSHIHPEDRESVRQTYQGALSANELAAEFRIVWPDRTVHWIWTRGHTLCDAAGRPHSIAGIVMDISDRKHEEQRVGLLAGASRILCDSLRSGGGLQDIAQLAVGGMASFCFFDLLNDANGKVERIASACSESSPIGLADRIPDLLPPIDSPISRSPRDGMTQFIPEVTDAWVHAIARNQPHYETMHAFDLQSLIVVPIAVRELWLGTFTLCRAGAQRQPYTPGDVAAAEELGRRVAVSIANARVRRSLSESEQRFRAVADDAPAMIWTSGEDALCGYFNKAWMAFTGRTLEQELGNGWAESVHPEDLDGCLQDYSAFFQTHRPFTLVYRLRRHDGQYRWVFDSAIPRFSSEGQFTGYVGYGADITDRREADERLRESAKLKSLGVIAGGIAHDFNNLLVGIIGNTSLAADLLLPSHPARPLLEDVLHSGEKAAALTRQMLAYAGKGRFVSKAIDLSQLVDEIVPLVRASIQKKVRLSLNLARGLPPIEADPSQIQQIIMNLVINAAEACDPEKDGLVAVTTSLRQVDEGRTWAALGTEELTPGTYVCLEVQDNGCGMDELTKAKVFDPFFTTKFTGRGLGLSAVLGIIRSHKGAIRLQSALGTGSRFEVLFAGSPERANAAVDQTPPREPAQQSGTILVVDDEEMVRKTVSVALRRCGYGVILAANGRDAIEKFRVAADDVAAVLLDLTMPLMGGEETFRLLRVLRPGVPVIVTSGYDEVEVARRFTGNGVTFIQKPFKMSQLAEEIKAATQAKR